MQHIKCRLCTIYESQQELPKRVTFLVPLCVQYIGLFVPHLVQSSWSPLGPVWLSRPLNLGRPSSSMPQASLPSPASALRLQPCSPPPSKALLLKTLELPNTNIHKGTSCTQSHYLPPWPLANHQFCAHQNASPHL